MKVTVLFRSTSGDLFHILDTHSPADNGRPDLLAPSGSDNNYDHVLYAQWSSS